MRIKILAFLLRKLLPRGLDTETLMPVLKPIDYALATGLSLAVFSYKEDADDIPEYYEQMLEDDDDTEKFRLN